MRTIEARVDDVLTITRADELQALGDPTRWRILGRLLDGPASIQQLARSLGAAKGTIGHHVRVLNRAGLIRLADTTPVRGVIEKRYARVAKQFKLPDSGHPLTDAYPEVATMPLRQAIAEAQPTRDPDRPSMSFVVRARMPAERAKRFAGLLELLRAEFADGAPGTGEAFGFAAAIYVPNWSVADPKES
jgi:DNA-binding transcriptional ArsR family regulator